jgi:ribose transport system permease protein
VFAIGSNEEAGRLSGLAVSSVKRWVYSLSGLAAGLAGVMQFSRLSTGVPTDNIGLELDVIAAVVIGGGSLRGGEGSILGTLIGAFILGFMRNGCTLAGIPNPVQRILVGGIIILAVAIDERRHRRQ